MGYVSPIRRNSVASVAAVVLLGLAGAALLLAVAGVGKDNTRFLGVPTGRQTPPTPGGDWGQALAAACQERGLSDVERDPWRTKLEYTMAPRRCYYRTELTGTRDGKRVKVRAVLTAPDGGAWVLTEWVEQ
jgi:hypothetical protein